MFWKGEHSAMNPILIYIIMGGMFLFVVVTAIKYVVAKIRFIVARRTLRRNGDIVPGRIIEHSTQRAYSWFSRFGSGAYDIFFLTFQFEYQGESYTSEKRVSEKTYLTLQDGDTIRVRCLPGHPVLAEAVDV